MNWFHLLKNCCISILFGPVSESVLLDSGAFYNFIAWSQVIKFSNSIQKPFLCHAEPREVHLADNSSANSHQIVHLPHKYAGIAVCTVELWVVPALNHAIILGTLFLYKFILSIN